MHRSNPSGQAAAQHTHEIRDQAGEWIWMGGEGDMSLIFANLNGRHFEGRPESYAAYLQWARWSTAEAWPGRDHPLAPGKTVVLAKVNGPALEEHRFPLKLATHGG